jgi:acetoin utilization protein AcuB
MFVSNSMTRKVVTISKNATIFDAKDLMGQHRIRHLPVVEPDNTLVGIVTDRDLRSALPYDMFKKPDIGAEKDRLSRLTVADIMTSDPFTISPQYTIQDTLLLIQEKRVGAFPVVDDQGRLTGIISVRDLLRAFINVLGIGEPGTLVGILVDEEVGQLKKIVDAITAEKISFGSVLVARYWEKDKRAVFPYLLTNQVGAVKKKLRAMGYTLIDPMEWVIDQLPQKE